MQFGDHPVQQPHLYRDAVRAKGVDRSAGCTLAHLLAVRSACLFFCRCSSRQSQPETFRACVPGTNIFRVLHEEVGQGHELRAQLRNRLPIDSIESSRSRPADGDKSALEEYGEMLRNGRSGE